MQEDFSGVLFFAGPCVRLRMNLNGARVSEKSSGWVLREAAGSASVQWKLMNEFVSESKLLYFRDVPVEINFYSFKLCI